MVRAMVDPVWYRVVGVSGEVMSIGEVYAYLTTRLGEHEKLARTLNWYKENRDDLSAAQE